MRVRAVVFEVSDARARTRLGESLALGHRDTKRRTQEAEYMISDGRASRDHEAASIQTNGCLELVEDDGVPQGVVEDVIVQPTELRIKRHSKHGCLEAARRCHLADNRIVDSSEQTGDAGSKL